MALFDKISEKFNQTTGISKLNGMISAEEKQISSCFCEMGKICFEKYPETPEALIAELVAKVNDSKTKLEDYSEQVKKLKGFVTCECGTDVSPDNTFCNSCGARVRIEPTANTGTNGRVCDKCGTSVTDGKMFCSGCGQKIEAAEAEKKCKSCNANLIDGMAFCTGCGQQIEE